jgi:tRNA U34 5-methylaminomethyl-2-thiouridine-forming methyltransferase MnmC
MINPSLIARLVYHHSLLFDYSTVHFIRISLNDANFNTQKRENRWLE